MYFLLFGTVATILFFLMGRQMVVAYDIGYLYRDQERVQPNTKVISFMEHPGMWGGIFISLLVAFVITSFHRYWSWGEITFWFATSAILFLIFVELWRWDSLRVSTHCAVEGVNTPACPYHYVYGVIAFATMFLFYFATPKEVVQPVAAFVTTILVIYIGMGTCGVEWVSDKDITKRSALPAFTLWTILLAAYWRIVH